MAGRGHGRGHGRGQGRGQGLGRGGRGGLVDQASRDAEAFLESHARDERKRQELDSARARATARLSSGEAARAEAAARLESRRQHEEEQRMQRKADGKARLDLRRREAAAQQPVAGSSRDSPTPAESVRWKQRDLEETIEEAKEIIHLRRELRDIEDAQEEIIKAKKFPKEVHPKKLPFRHEVALMRKRLGAIGEDDEETWAGEGDRVQELEARQELKTLQLQKLLDKEQLQDAKGRASDLLTSWRGAQDCRIPDDLPDACDRAASFASHTVFVVDNSGSMKDKDCEPDGGGAPISRRDAIRQMLIDRYVRDQLEAGASSADRVTLIKMEDRARVPFAMQPCDHKLGALIATCMHSRPRNDGNYLPALDQLCEACALARPYMAHGAQTSIFFLSDGRPSDETATGKGSIEVANLAKSRLQILAADCYGSGYGNVQFQWQGMGKGRPKDKETHRTHDDFWLLNELSGYCRRLFGSSSFEVSGGSAKKLATSIASFSASVSASRFSSRSHAQPGEKRELRAVNTDKLKQYTFVRYPGATMFSAPPAGKFTAPLIKKGQFDVEVGEGRMEEGGERNVFHMRFCDESAFKKFNTSREERWVVKENKLVEGGGDDEKELDFHRVSMVTQQTATFFAQKFNDLAHSRELHDLPTISFMRCALIQTSVCRPPSRQTDEPAKRWLFAERHIEGEFRKYNNNFGGTYIASAASASGSATARSSSKRPMLESFSEQEEFDEEGKEERKSDGEAVSVSLEDVPQAFSHFSINGVSPLERLKGPDDAVVECCVCDVQGSFSAAENTFKLIDPCIHSKMQDGGRGLFGRTDHGEKGITEFLKTHSLPWHLEPGILPRAHLKARDCAHPRRVQSRVRAARASQQHKIREGERTTAHGYVADEPQGFADYGDQEDQPPAAAQEGTRHHNARL